MQRLLSSYAQLLPKYEDHSEKLKCQGSDSCTHKPTMFLPDPKLLVCLYCYHEISSTSQISISRLSQLNPQDILSRLNPKIQTSDFEKAIEERVGKLSQKLQEIKQNIVKSVRKKFGAEPSEKALALAQQVLQAKQDCLTEGHQVQSFVRLSKVEKQFVIQNEKLKKKNMPQILKNCELDFEKRAAAYESSLDKFGEIAQDFLNEEVKEPPNRKQKKIDEEEAAAVVPDVAKSANKRGRKKKDD